MTTATALSLAWAAAAGIALCSAVLGGCIVRFVLVDDAQRTMKHAQIMLESARKIESYNEEQISALDSQIAALNQSIALRDQAIEILDQRSRTTSR